MAGPYKMKGSPMQRNFGIGSPVKQEKASDYVTRTEGSKKIQKGIENMSKEEKNKIMKRNLESFQHARLKTGEKYRDQMPAGMQDLATRADSVRAVVYDDIESIKKSPTPQKYTQQDTTRAIGVRRAELDSRGASADYRPSTSETDLGTNWKKLLKETDKNTNDNIETYNVLRRGNKKNMNKKRLKNLNKKAVKGTKANTKGVIRGDRD